MFPQRLSATMGGLTLACLLFLLSLSGTAQAKARLDFQSCFQAASARYQIDTRLLMAIAEVESGMNPAAIGVNRNRKGQIISRDFGLMQINSTHVPKLQALGVLRNEQDLLNQPCLNVMVGGWVLARHLQVCGVTWECLGSYNAGFAEDNGRRRMLYARKVYARYTGGR